MMRTLLSPGQAVALAGRGGQQNIVIRNLAPISLLQILAGMLGAWVIAAMKSHRHRPVVGRPCHLDSSHSGPLGEATCTGKQINCLHDIPLIFEKMALFKSNL